MRSNHKNAARCVITYPASLVASCVNTNAGMCTRVYKQLLSALISARVLQPLSALISARVLQPLSALISARVLQPLISARVLQSLSALISACVLQPLSALISARVLQPQSALISARVLQPLSACCGVFVVLMFYALSVSPLLTTPKFTVCDLLLCLQARGLWCSSVQEESPATSSSLHSMRVAPKF